MEVFMDFLEVSPLFNITHGKKNEEFKKLLRVDGLFLRIQIVEEVPVPIEYQCNYRRMESPLPYPAIRDGKIDLSLSDENQFDNISECLSNKYVAESKEIDYSLMMKKRMSVLAP